MDFVHEVKISRRRFLQVGLLGAGALALARMAYLAQYGNADTTTALDARGAAIFAAIVPAMLDTALPAAPAARQSAIEETLRGIEAAIAGLPPPAQRELHNLISLLAFAPSRSLVAGIWSAWPEASPEAVSRFLADWRASRFQLLRSAYQALHQLVYAAWYGGERAWSAIGYAGPPELRP